MKRHDPIDPTPERASREEQEKLDRTHGQFILDMAAGRANAEDPLLVIVQRAHEAKAEEGALRQNREPGGNDAA